MAEDNVIYSIVVNEKIDLLLKRRYEEYSSEVEDSINFEEFVFHILKIGILSNEIKIYKHELSEKEKEVGNVNAKLSSLRREYDSNRRKLNYPLF